MTVSSHIKFSLQGSLENRIADCQKAIEGYNRAIASQKSLEDGNWAETLGEADDIIAAIAIYERSLSMIMSTLDRTELAVAVEQGLLDQSEFKTISDLKNKQEFKEKLQHQRQSHSNQDQQEM